MTARNELPSDSTRKPGPGAYRPEQVKFKSLRLYKQPNCYFMYNYSQLQYTGLFR